MSSQTTIPSSTESSPRWVFVFFSCFLYLIKCLGFSLFLSLLVVLSPTFVFLPQELTTVQTSDESWLLIVTGGGLRVRTPASESFWLTIRVLAKGLLWRLWVPCRCFLLSLLASLYRRRARWLQIYPPQQKLWRLWVPMFLCFLWCWEGHETCCECHNCESFALGWAGIFRIRYVTSEIRLWFIQPSWVWETYRGWVWGKKFLVSASLPSFLARYHSEVLAFVGISSAFNSCKWV